MCSMHTYSVAPQGGMVPIFTWNYFDRLWPLCARPTGRVLFLLHYYYIVFSLSLTISEKWV